jgi:predicted SAM-dependent methyltransferase
MPNIDTTAGPDSKIKYAIHGSDKLHLGCGRHRIENWGNFDMDMDLRESLPLGDESIRLVFTEHVIEHLHPPEAWRLFKEIRRILIPGGGLRFIFPCVDLIHERFDTEYGDFVKRKTKIGNSLEAAMEAIICRWNHRAIWTVGSMRSVLTSLGFYTWESAVGVSQFPEAVGIEGHGKCIGGHANWVESGVVEAVKPR